MHVNHRRKNKLRVDRTRGRNNWLDKARLVRNNVARSGALLRRWWRPWYRIHIPWHREDRRASWQERRSQARRLMAHGRYDDLPDRYRRDIIWRYW